ncbi:MAG TPA: hypothetical protein VKM55_05820 [Candidatus Lokiarchaeia archaeon]|nr:hypothetical protein [Candidatus Lokiarchaeia archaeon]
MQQSKMDNAEQSSDNYLVPWYAVGIVAIICAIALIVIAILGPAVLNMIHYRTSQSGIWQTEAFDITDLLVLAPILFIGGVLQLAKKSSAKYFLILSPITLMIVGLEYGLGEEWSSTAFPGNVEVYSWLYLIIVIGGLILLISSLSSFTRKDAPSFNRKGLKFYVGIMAIFLLLFAVMWISQINEVIATGNTTDGSYLAAPTSFWVVKYFDLGITIPVGIIALLLLLSKPKIAYPLILLFFGFFITLATSVNASAIILVINKDPSISGSGAGGLVIFPVLAILAYAGLFYLIKDKLKTIRSKHE